jgi:hypothetical protein
VLGHGPHRGRQVAVRLERGTVIVIQERSSTGPFKAAIIGTSMSSQDHHVIGAVLADALERMDGLLMRVAVEDQCAAVNVKGDFARDIRRADEAGVRKRFAISVERRPLKSPYRRGRIFVFRS